MKLEGQESVLREQLQQPAVANLIANLRERLADAETLDRVRYLESGGGEELLERTGVKFRYCFHVKT